MSAASVSQCVLQLQRYDYGGVDWIQDLRVFEIIHVVPLAARERATAANTQQAHSRCMCFPLVQQQANNLLHSLVGADVIPDEASARKQAFKSDSGPWQQWSASGCCSCICHLRSAQSSCAHACILLDSCRLCCEKPCCVARRSG